MKPLKQKGFTLVEIMVVVAIIGLLVSIAIPVLIRMRMNANEATIKADLRTFSTANETFRTSQNPVRYANDVNELASNVPEYVDTTWLVNPRHQYNFSYFTNAQATSYSMIGIPTPNGGFNTYCIDQSGTITGSVNGGGAPTGGTNGCVGGTVLSG